MDDNELDTLIRRHGLQGIAAILTDLIHQNGQSGALTELCVRLAMAYGIRVGQMDAVAPRQFDSPAWRRKLGMDITK